MSLLTLVIVLTFMLPGFIIFLGIAFMILMLLGMWLMDIIFYLGNWLFRKARFDNNRI